MGIGSNAALGRKVGSTARDIISVLAGNFQRAKVENAVTDQNQQVATQQAAQQEAATNYYKALNMVLQDARARNVTPSQVRINAQAAFEKFGRPFGLAQGKPTEAIIKDYSAEFTKKAERETARNIVAPIRAEGEEAAAELLAKGAKLAPSIPASPRLSLEQQARMVDEVAEGAEPSVGVSGRMTTLDAIMAANLGEESRRAATGELLTGAERARPADVFKTAERAISPLNTELKELRTAEDLERKRLTSAPTFDVKTNLLQQAETARTAENFNLAVNLAIRAGITGSGLDVYRASDKVAKPGAAPIGFKFSEDGVTLEFIKGGPSDPDMVEKLAKARTVDTAKQRNKKANLVSRQNATEVLQNLNEAQGPNSVARLGWQMNDDGSLHVDPIDNAPVKLPGATEVLGKRGNIKAITMLGEARDDAVQMLSLINDPTVQRQLENVWDSEVLSLGENALRKWLTERGLGTNDNGVGEVVWRMQKMASEERKQLLGAAVTDSELRSVLSWMPDSSKSLGQITTEVNLLANESDEVFMRWLDIWKNRADMSQFYDAFGIDRFKRQEVGETIAPTFRVDAQPVIPEEETPDTNPERFLMLGGPQ